MDTILNSLVVTFISLGLLVLAISVFVGYVIHKASELGGPGFVSQTGVSSNAFQPNSAESATELGLGGHPRDTSTRFSFRGSSANSRQEPRGGLRRPSGALPKGEPCSFCAWLRRAFKRG